MAKKSVKAWVLIFYDASWRIVRTRKEARAYARYLNRSIRPQVIPCTIVFDLPKKRAKK